MASNTRKAVFGPAGQSSRSPLPTRFTLKEVQAAADWLPVTSSNVKAICYRPDLGDGDDRWGLGVWFAPQKNGKPTGKQTVYWYNVSYEVYQAMKHAPSKGTFVHAVLIARGYPVSGPHPPGG